jgi:hypothetical protein
MLRSRIPGLLLLAVPLVWAGCGSGSSDVSTTTTGTGSATTTTTGTSANGTSTVGGTTGITTTGGGTSSTGGTTPSGTGTSGTGGTTTGTTTGASGLIRLNQVRALANLPAVTEDSTDPNFDPGCQLHAEWIVANNVLTDSETPGTVNYTVAGAAAASQSNAESSTADYLTMDEAIDGLMTGPFHGIGFIDAALISTGFGLFNDPSLPSSVIRSGAVINVIGARTSSVSPNQYPVIWPANGQTLPYTSFSGNEFPDPSSSLPAGFTQNAGPNTLGCPLMVQFATTPRVSSFSLVENGSVGVNVGEIDETNYVNPNANTQSEGREILAARHCVVLMSETPLMAGASYQASITNSNVPVTWTFNVSTTPITQKATSRGVNRFH